MDDGPFPDQYIEATESLHGKTDYGSSPQPILIRETFSHLRPFLILEVPLKLVRLSTTTVSVPGHTLHGCFSSIRTHELQQGIRLKSICLHWKGYFVLFKNSVTLRMIKSNRGYHHSGLLKKIIRFVKILSKKKKKSFFYFHLHLPWENVAFFICISTYFITCFHFLTSYKMVSLSRKYFFHSFFPFFFFSLPFSFWRDTIVYIITVRL